MRAASGLGALAIAGALLAGCAGAPPAAYKPGGADGIDAGLAARPAGDALVRDWSRQLDGYVDSAGHGDPSVLAQLPVLRSAPGPRPAQIVFRANDLGAVHPGLDGYDLSGLLVGRLDRGGQPWYLFIVGAVERDGGRPVALTGLRLAALWLQDGRPHWQFGSADAQAQQRYESRRGAQRVLHFPGDTDRFALVPCAPALCVEEANSGARWRLD